MKKKGFTLIELLAVIVIIAVIALISMPIILNVVEKARKGAFEDSAYGIIDAAKLYYAGGYLDGNGNGETFIFPDDTKLKLSGTKPKSGSVKLEKDGKIAIAISNGQWCAVKDNNEEKVRITDYSLGDCEIENVETPSTPESCFIVNENDPSEIIDYICDDKDVVIPKIINGVEVKKIATYSLRTSSFAYKQLMSVVIPSTVTTIGDNAFKNNLLKEVVIPKGVVSIGNGAFLNNQLMNVVISEGVINIGVINALNVSGAFQNNLLDYIMIPSSVTYIHNDTFLNNQENMKVTVNKAEGSISGSPWGASFVEWIG